MAVQTILPETNLTYTDIRDTLNAGGGSVDNTVASAFKPTAKINIFSKHKPVIRKVDFCQDFDSTKPNYFPEWWKGTSGNCGIVFKNVSSPSDLPDVIDGELNGWEHQLPQGGENAPFRLGDFCGYDSNAKPFVEGFSLSRVTVENKSSSSFSVNFIVVPDETKPTSLTFSDFNTSLANYYPAVYIRKGTLGYFISASNTVSSGSNLSVDVPTNGLDTGEWEVYTFLSEVKIPTLSTVGSIALGYCYTIPYTDKKGIEVVSTLMQIIIHPTKSATSNTIHIKVTVNSLLLGTQSFTNNWVYVRRLNQDISDNLYAKNIQLDTLSLANGVPTVIYDQDVQVDSELYNNGCTVYVTINGGDYSNRNNLISDSPTPTT